MNNQPFKEKRMHVHPFSDGCDMVDKLCDKLANALSDCEQAIRTRDANYPGCSPDIAASQARAVLNKYVEYLKLRNNPPADPNEADCSAPKADGVSKERTSYRMAADGMRSLAIRDGCVLLEKIEHDLRSGRDLTRDQMLLVVALLEGLSMTVDQHIQFGMR